MIKFFRKIRYDLMEKNKTGKYLKYAIGEIILVVVGILIALSINNWNQSKKQDIAEIEFIAGVRNDLIQDKEYIKVVLELMEPKINAYNLLSRELPKLYDEDKSSLDSILKMYFIGQRTFYPISGSFESAISGNEINTYKNKEVTRSIIKLYNSIYVRIIGNGKMLDDRWAFVSKKYSYERRTGHHREMNNKQISEFLDDTYYHFIQMRWYRDLLTNAIVDMDELLSKME